MTLQETQQTGKSILVRRGLTASSVSLGFLWLIYGLDSISKQMIYMVLPAVTKEFNLSPASSGLMTTLVSMSTAVICVPVMMWADRGGYGWRRKYRHLPIVIGYTAFTFLTGFNVLTGSLGLLIVMQVLSHSIGGAGEAMEVASAGEWWSKQRRGMALGIHHTGYPWGTLIGGFAVSAILAHVGSQNWRDAFLFFPIPVAVVFTLYWFFATRSRYQVALDGMKAADQTEPQPPAHENTGGWAGTKVALRNPNIGVTAVVATLAIVGYYGISYWLPQYLAFVANYSLAAVAAYSVLFTITGGLGQIFWGFLSDRVGRKLCLIIVLAWLVVSMTLFQFSNRGIGTLIAIELIAGFGMNAPYTLLYATAFDSVGEGSIGMASSIINSGIYIGGFSPYLIGWIIGVGGGFKSVTGYNVALYFLAGLILIALVLTALFMRETVGWFRAKDRALVSREACNLTSES